MELELEGLVRKRGLLPSGLQDSAVAQSSTLVLITPGSSSEPTTSIMGPVQNQNLRGIILKRVMGTRAADAIVVEDERESVL
ncbi:hypothetical protein DPEC_G00316610 [Dallia pectoralis]|uniref:Uncharacterized protein n=1 Tax=Dallia pectoralis TaxID=75939 RepID=A0ACC2FCT5_DALPE|nr:hypothetical protein DPEC_G00316610 [Dallia pectoralis]